MGIYPRREQEARVLTLNKGIQSMAKSEGVGFEDIGKKLLLKTGKIDETYYSDGLHPNAVGYELLGKEIQPILR